MPDERTRKWLIWEIGAAAAVVMIVATVLVVVTMADEPQPTAAPPVSSVAPTTSVAKAPPPPPSAAVPVVAIKIDNVDEARPHTGLGAAQVIYVEPVEGGLTRLVAVYAGTPPAVVGPVRSARRTDIELLAQYGRPVLAYSGAAPELLPALRAARLINASPDEAGPAFYRDDDRTAPHNLYLRPARLPGGATAPATAPLRFGVTPYAGVPDVRYEVRFRAAEYDFAWSASAREWLVSMNGTPMVSTDSGRLTAANVVEQRVVVSTDEAIEDASGKVSPVVRTVGTGRAVVLRDGQRYTATWSRPNAAAPTTFRTANGLDLPLASGPVWVLLTPA